MSKKILIGALLILCCSLAHAHTWKPLAEGLSYTHIQRAHVFQIDPKKYNLSIATAQDIGKSSATVKEMVKKNGAWLAVNGGFFSYEPKSVGLLMRKEKIINPLHSTSWWGIFYLENGIAKITTPQEFHRTAGKVMPSSQREREGEAPVALPLEGATRAPKIEMAVQAGPRLVIQGEIPKLKAALDRRTGIGIRRDGHIFLAVVLDEISTTDFAELFSKPEKEGGLGCNNALNLDGGSSTQLYFNNGGNFSLDLPGINWVTNAVTISPRY